MELAEEGASEEDDETKSECEDEEENSDIVSGLIEEILDQVNINGRNVKSMEILLVLGVVVGHAFWKISVSQSNLAIF